MLFRSVDSRPVDTTPVYDSDDGGNLSDLYCTFRADAGAGKTMVLADTGSQIHVTTEAYAKKLGKPIGLPLCDNIGGIGGASGSLGSVEIDLNFQGCISPVNCDIVAALQGNLSLIVGQPLLRSHE